MDSKNTPLISELISKHDTQDQSKQDRIDKAEKDFEFIDHILITGEQSSVVAGLPEQADHYKVRLILRPGNKHEQANYFDNRC